MTLTKLSLRNARNQTSDYLVYFITIIIAAALIYAFNGLVVSNEIQGLSMTMQNLSYIIVSASIVVVLIIGWLINYTMRFMLTKRSRELGTYILLGIEPRKVAQMFFVENLAIGIVALGIGVCIGNLIFHALHAAIFRLFSTAHTFRFSFSVQALGLTVLYFAVIYLFALLKSRKHIRKMKIYDLIYFEKQNESAAIKKSKSRKRLFTASLLCGIIGTALLTTLNLKTNLIGAVLLIFFLYGFFMSFSSGIPSYYEKRPTKKYQGHKLLTFRTLSSKLSTIGVTMATIALLFTATLVAEGSGMVFYTQFQRQSEMVTSYDLLISSRSTSDFSRYEAYIEEHIPVRQSRTYETYEGDDDNISQHLLNNADYWTYLEKDTVLKMSDYSALRQMLGYEPVTLHDGQYILHCMDYLAPALEAYGKEVAIGGTLLTKGPIYTEVFTQYTWDGNGRGFIIVVPDELAGAQPVCNYIYAAMTDIAVSGTLYESLIALQPDTTDDHDMILSKAAQAEENASLHAMILFPLYYLSFVFMMVAATILSIHLLSDTAKLKQQYQILYNFGMDYKEMKKSLNRQFALFYAMPTIPAIIICITFLFSFIKVLDPGTIASTAQPFFIIGTALLLFLAIYAVYIIASHKSLKREVLPQQ